jgi:hypothetical protein
VPYREQFRRTVESGDVLEIHAVLSLYPNFVKAHSLLSMLDKMYKKSSPAMRDVIHSVLKFWCEARFAVDFTIRAGKGNKVFNRLLRLLNTITKLNPTWSSSSPSPVLQIKLTLLRNHTSHYATKHVLPKYSKIADSLATIVKVNKDEYSQYMSLVAWASPAEIALRLCAIEFTLFKRILPRELMNLNWTRPANRSLCVNTLEMIARSNNVAFWVSTKILSADESHRVNTIEKMVEIADALCNMRAYNPLMGVLGGLNQQPVQRLKKTWARVSPKHVQLFAKLDEFFSVKSNYKNYRAALLKARTTPGMFALPYLGVTLRDMVFIYEGANTVVEGDLSMQKLSLLSTVLRELRDFQRRDMSPKAPELDSLSQTYFEGLVGVSEETLWSLSRAIEAPRSLVPDDSDSSLSQQSASSLTTPPSSAASAVGVPPPSPSPAPGAPNSMNSSSSSISPQSSPASSNITRKQ